MIVNGRVCLDEGLLKAVEGYGRFLDTAVFPPFVYDPEEAAKIVESIDIGNLNGNDVVFNNKLAKVREKCDFSKIEQCTLRFYVVFTCKNI